MRTPEPSPELTPRGRHRARPADADHLVGNLEHAFGLTERTPGLGARQTREAAFQAQREARDAGEPMPTVAATAVALFAAILVQRMQNHGLAPCSAEASGAFDGSGPAPGF